MMFAKCLRDPREKERARRIQTKRDTLTEALHVAGKIL